MQAPLAASPDCRIKLRFEWSGPTSRLVNGQLEEIKRVKIVVRPGNAQYFIEIPQTQFSSRIHTPLITIYEDGKETQAKILTLTTKKVKGLQPLAEIFQEASATAESEVDVYWKPIALTIPSPLIKGGSYTLRVVASEESLSAALVDFTEIQTKLMAASPSIVGILLPAMTAYIILLLGSGLKLNKGPESESCACFLVSYTLNNLSLEGMTLLSSKTDSILKKLAENPKKNAALLLKACYDSYGEGCLREMMQIVFRSKLQEPYTEKVEKLFQQCATIFIRDCRKGSTIIYDHLEA